jgi:hypothetical protein
MALVLSLSLAVICSAVVARSLAALRLSHADFQRGEQELGLDGAHLAAAVVIIRHGEPGAFRWGVTTDQGYAEVIAEPEINKLGLLAAAALDDDVFDALGVVDPSALKARLYTAASAPPSWLGGLDSAPLWKQCSDSLLSAYGVSDRPAPLAYVSPERVADKPGWHIGETWRIRITTDTGWRDDRIVRFTGDPEHPEAIVRRAFTKTSSGRGSCDKIMAAMAGA